MACCRQNGGEHIHEKRESKGFPESHSSFAADVSEFPGIDIAQYGNKAGQQYEKHLKQRNGEAERKKSELNNQKTSIEQQLNDARAQIELGNQQIDNAKEQADEIATATMEEATSGLQLPEGVDLPM